MRNRSSPSALQFIFRNDLPGLVDELAKTKDSNQLDRAGRSLLMNAVADEETSLELVSFLVGRGGVNDADSDGLTALHFASALHRVDVVELLLKHGAKVDSKDKTGNSPLWRATMSARDGDVNARDTIVSLVSAGAAIDASNLAGSSPLDVAIHRAQPQIVSLLRNTARNRGR